MKQLTHALLLLTVLLATPALAQSDGYDRADHVSIYFTFNAAHASNADRGYSNDVQPFATPTPEQYASFWHPAFGAGVSIHIVRIARTSLAFDARGSNTGVYLSHTPYGAHSDVGYFLGGLHLAYLPRGHRIRPYAQFSYGAFGTFAPAVDPYIVTSTCLFCYPTYGLGQSSRNATYRGYEVMGGADIPLTDHTTFRAAELGFAEAGDGSNQYNGRALKTLTVFHIDTGILFHF